MDLLFLAHRAPYPPDRGDKIRAFHILHHIAERARVHLVAFADDPRDLVPPPAFAARLASCTVLPRTKSRSRAAVEALATGRPVSLAAFADPRFAEAVARVRARATIDCTYAFSGQTAQYLRPGDRAIVDFVDVDSAKFATYAAAGGPTAWLMRREARLLSAFERRVAATTAASLFVSEAEAALFRDGGGKGRVLAVENGIDTARFDPATVAPADATGPLIVLTGQMDYPPNVEAARWLVGDILPLVRRDHPDAHVAIVGRAPTAAVRALARQPGVLVTGEVADVRPWLAAAAVVVAPLRLARGVQNKVLEAMAMARAVVASTDAAEGIDHRGTIRVGADAAAIAGEVAALLADPAAAARLGDSARARVIERYGWAARLASLDALLEPTPLEQAA